MKNRLLLILLLALPLAVSGQDTTELDEAPAPPADTLIRARNAIYLEGFGNGGYGSLNYDRILWQNNHWKVAGRLGAGFSYTRSFDYAAPLIPVEVIAMKGVYQHFMELGLGYTAGWAYKEFTAVEASPGNPAVFDLRKEFVTYGFARIGYRYQPSQSSWLFRLGITPIFAKTGRSENSFGFYPWAGVSLGRTF